MTSQLIPRDSQYKEKVIKSFAQQAVMKMVNASIVSVSPGETTLEFPFQSSLTQQNGFIHAGIVSTVLDSACGYAAFSLMSEDASVLSIEFKVNLLSPAKGDKFKAVGKVKKAGRNITVTEGELFSYTDGKEKLVATMTATMMAMYES